jgi:LPS sulfotransferase NodH
MWGYLGDLIAQLRTLPGGREGPTPALLAGAFPNLRYISIVRRDTVRQAVSWVRAIQTDVWMETGSEMRPAMPEPPFDFDTTGHLVREIERHNAAWEAYFREAGVAPFRVVYEELAERYEETALAVLAWLGIAAPADLRFAERRLRRQTGYPTRGWSAIGNSRAEPCRCAARSELSRYCPENCASVIRRGVPGVEGRRLDAPTAALYAAYVLYVV